MNAVMYLFLNRGLGMSPGKLAAQAGHAAVRAYRLTGPRMVEAWDLGGHETKLTMLARDTEHLLTIERYLVDRGFKTSLVIDEGRTEIPSHTPTALGVEIIDKDDPHMAATFGDFKLYRELPRERKRLLKW